MFPNRYEKLENNYPKIFTPFAPISMLSFLKGRNELLDDIKLPTEEEEQV
jgi:hypothetical protein